MTAIRVIDDHNDLANNGSVPHSKLDDFANKTPYVVTPGTLAPIPPSSRTLAAGSGIALTDGGPGGSLTITNTGGGGGAVIVWMEVPGGATNGSNVTFTLLNTPDAGTLMLYVNGVLLAPGAGGDYTISGTTITLAIAPRSNSNLFATYQSSGGVTGVVVWMETPSGVIDGVNVSFNLLNTPSSGASVMLFVNGVLLAQGVGADYTLSTRAITLAIAPRVNSNVFATYPT